MPWTLTVADTVGAVQHHRAFMLKGEVDRWIESKKPAGATEAKRVTYYDLLTAAALDEPPPRMSTFEACAAILNGYNAAKGTGDV